MKSIFIINILLCVMRLSAQDIKAKMIAENEVAIEISNPNELLFFISYQPYLNLIDINYILYVGDELSDCQYVIESPYVKRERLDRSFSGYYSQEKKIIQTYKIRYKECDQKEMKKNNVFIQFILTQPNLKEIKGYKEDLKKYTDEKIFVGELSSNKIPIKIN